MERTCSGAAKEVEQTGKEMDIRSGETISKNMARNEKGVERCQAWIEKKWNGAGGNAKESERNAK